MTPAFAHLLDEVVPVDADVQHDAGLVVVEAVDGDGSGVPGSV